MDIIKAEFRRHRFKCFPRAQVATVIMAGVDTIIVITTPGILAIVRVLGLVPDPARLILQALMDTEVVVTEVS